MVAVRRGADRHRKSQTVTPCTRCTSKSGRYLTLIATSTREPMLHGAGLLGQDLVLTPSRRRRHGSRQINAKVVPGGRRDCTASPPSTCPSRRHSAARNGSICTAGQSAACSTTSGERLKTASRVAPQCDAEHAATEPTEWAHPDRTVLRRHASQRSTVIT